ncbi:VOC family protein [Corallococcus sp. AB004]|uniref:VOC family protein n=1 Tax=Corallococcus exiguus TaxID=83462 RepID=UPI000EA2474D|nr:VOC family protein [Corallococcus exiguus]NPD28667.1 VOC family protein [Corallococcus exiguus]NRD44175.1 VOC family protein [Corallococcus exiguus]RKI34587.1 VOC family protein [Corallococcus sp. AB004]
MKNGFCWYELRSPRPGEARRFYLDVLGMDVAWEVSLLPEAAAARGAPSHWLGHIHVSDLESSMERFVALGAERLGPPRRSTEGIASTVLRDPLGAVVALTSRAGRNTHAELAWHELHTADHARALGLYSGLFGWRPTEALQLSPEVGTYQQFTWHEDGRSVGAACSTARLPHIHPHWLFYFAVDDLDRALAAVVEGGGLVANGTHVMPDGTRVAPCEDPHRAAFGLRQAP